MIPENLTDNYRQFFLKTDAGKYFTEELDRLIGESHTKAENNPELSRDCVQNAKGLRLIQDHIRSVVTKKKGEPS